MTKYKEGPIVAPLCDSVAHHDSNTCRLSTVAQRTIPTHLLSVVITYLRTRSHVRSYLVGRVAEVGEYERIDAHARRDADAAGRLWMVPLWYHTVY